MAIHAPITGAPLRAPFNPIPPAAITRILSRFERDALVGFVSVAIDLLDAFDGDPDDELAGDEQDGTFAEDEGGSLTIHGFELDGRGPGCTISDPDYCPVERGDKTTLETFRQGAGSAPHEDDDDEPARNAPHWPMPMVPANNS